jgi:hypothetical protein
MTSTNYLKRKWLSSWMHVSYCECLMTFWNREDTRGMDTILQVRIKKKSAGMRLSFPLTITFPLNHLWCSDSSIIIFYWSSNRLSRGQLMAGSPRVLRKHRVSGIRRCISRHIREWRCRRWEADRKTRWAGSNRHATCDHGRGCGSMLRCAHGESQCLLNVEK